MSIYSSATSLDVEAISLYEDASETLENVETIMLSDLGSQAEPAEIEEAPPLPPQQPPRQMRYVKRPQQLKDFKGVREEIWGILTAKWRCLIAKLRRTTISEYLTVTTTIIFPFVKTLLCICLVGIDVEFYRNCIIEGCSITATVVTLHSCFIGGIFIVSAFHLYCGFYRFAQFHYYRHAEPDEIPGMSYTLSTILEIIVVSASLPYIKVVETMLPTCVTISVIIILADIRIVLLCLGVLNE